MGTAPSKPYHLCLSVPLTPGEQRSHKPVAMTPKGHAAVRYVPQVTPAPAQAAWAVLPQQAAGVPANSIPAERPLPPPKVSPHWP